MRWLVSLYLVIRVWALNFTLLLPLVGAAGAQGELPLRDAAPLLFIALAFHVFAYVLNDVADLWVDRSEPLRADSPRDPAGAGLPSSYLPVRKPPARG